MRFVPSKNQQYHPKGIERGHQGSHQGKGIQSAVEHAALLPDRCQNGIFTEETTGQRQSGQTKGSGKEGVKGCRHASAETPHAEDILFMIHGGNDAAGPQKEQGFEESVLDQDGKLMR